MEETTHQDFDIAIVGAGPAGSSAAIRLASAGLSVLLVEQKKFPRDKLCGEFVSPECFTHLDEVGVLPDLMSAGGANLRETKFFGRNGRSFGVESEWFTDDGKTALGLSRGVMDAVLMERAREAGVDVREETSAAGLITDDGRVVGVNLTTKGHAETPVAARLTIDATGRTRSLARKLGNAELDKAPAEFVAFKTHVTGALIPVDVCEMYTYRTGYGGCNKVEDDLYNLCFIAPAADTKRLGSDPERVLREVVCGNARAAGSLADAIAVKPWLAVPITRFGRGELTPAEGLLTVGDSAAFVDPFTGSGILLALQSARIMSAVITREIYNGFDQRNIATEYRRQYARAFDARLRVCSLLRNAAFSPFIAETAIAALGLSRPLVRLVARATRSERNL
ncbi:NAD(P)/FAD-dependent oxidoreductase [soil metagenome]